MKMRICYAMMLVFTVALPMTLAAYCHRPDWDCTGHDIRRLDATAKECQRACDDEPACKSIQSFQGTCWLKNYACTNGELNLVLGANDYVKFDGKCGQSQYKRPSNKYCHRPNLNCGGNDLVSIDGTSGPKQCQNLCDMKKECVAIQVLNDGKCWLKRKSCANHELAPVKDANDYVKLPAGVLNCNEYKKPKSKYCHRANTNCGGHDIVHLTWVIDNKQCRYLCDWNKNCLSIQWYNGNCWLKKYACKNSEVTPLVNANDYVKIAADGSCAEYKVQYKYRYCKRADSDCGGHDLESFDTEDEAYCQQMCGYRDNCVAIQFTGSKCYLKNYQCRKGQLRTITGAADYIKIARSANCKKELEKLG